MSFEEDVSTILATLRLESNDELTGLYYSFEDLYERKLWHQLTAALDEFYHDSTSSGIRLRVFNNFIMKFYKKINQLKFVEFLLLSVDEISDNLEKVEFLSSIDAKIIKDLPSEESKSSFNLGLHESYNQTDDKVQAHIYLQVAIAKVSLYLSKFEDARKILDDCSAKIDELNIIGSQITSAYYSTNAEFYKLKSDYNNYYRNSLLYLSSIDKEYLATKVSTIEKTRTAYELGIAALLGDDIYNFGELLLHDILNFLDDASGYTWLKELLFTLDHGDLANFQTMLPTIEVKSPLLYSNIHFLKQKICLMSLTEAIFEKPNGKRILTFQEIATNTLTDTNDVEFLVMRALSLGLIKGFIDQIKQTVTVSWVQPRIMNRDQITSMKTKLENWSSNVNKLSGFVEVNGEGIWSEA
ncbi:proteasome regulatory particle lid subunit [Saccharomycopsis crataegensis]|uniref:Proteasome regulatory particle lid subunit n=1 Tax=Saccharomycopsis crataegensis TaxID=43959 RepID=A0AAV5QNQ5_9ASCO|nr:proteasome regulatory particle lid subunit [Saccharomycopsis crataegensis]